MNAQIEQAMKFSTKYTVIGQVAVQVAADEDIFDVLAGVGDSHMQQQDDGSFEVWGVDADGEEWLINVTLLRAA